MSKDEFVYVSHMLDKAHEALSLVRGKTRQDYDRAELTGTFCFS